MRGIRVERVGQETGNNVLFTMPVPNLNFIGGDNAGGRRVIATRPKTNNN